MEDMRCKKGHFLKHFILPDDELKKKGYAVDILDESTLIFLLKKASTHNTFPWISNDSKSLKYYSIHKILAWTNVE